MIVADELDNCPPEVLAFWRNFAALTTSEWALDPAQFAVIDLHPEAAERLKRFWEHGKGGAEVGWGTKGAMRRCIALNRDHMRDPGGYCALRHKAVTGEWPTEHGKAGIPS